MSFIITLHLFASEDFNYHTSFYRLFSLNEFVSPLQQHLNTLKFTVIFLSIFSRFIPMGLFIYHLPNFIKTNIPNGTILFVFCRFDSIF